MGTPRIKYEKVLRAIESGWFIITGSRRLAREIRLAYADHKSVSVTAWADPPVMQWSEWLVRLWQESTWFYPEAQELRLLSPGQQRLLWEQIIRRMEREHGLLQVPASARHAASAWDTAWAWDLSWEQVEAFASEDSARFLRWSQEYRAVCRERGWIDHARLPQELIRQLERTPPGVLAERILLAGFDELAPQQEALVSCLESRGTRIERWLPHRQPDSVGRLQVEEADLELLAAASWAKSRIAKVPASSIGVVIPDLELRHDTVARVFEDMLAPGACEGLAGPDEQIFSISAGPPLAANAMVATALALLEVAHDGPAWIQTSAVLRSPFLGDADEESDGRAELDRAMRECPGTRWPLQRVLALLDQTADGKAGFDCPGLHGRLRHALDLRSGWPERQDMHAWVLCFSAWLEALGWPGQRSLTSAEFQLQQRWRELLEEMAAYEILLGELDYQGALAVLKGLCSETRFKPESRRCPIQVLGTLEAAGLEFDKIWVCGLHDEAWPPAASPSPFLPYSLQRALGMPHGSAKRELEVARLQLDRLIASAGEVVLSWPATADDRALRPSPLIEEYGQIDQSQGRGLTGNREKAIFDSRPALETVTDYRGPPLAGDGTVAGGTRAVELQAVCPFRAFAELRLSAGRLERPAPGINALERGLLVHDCLHRFWRQVGDHASLRGMSAESRRSTMQRCLQASMAPLEADAGAIRKRLLRLERRRLHGLLGALLALELERPAFTVEMTESRRRLTAGPLELSARLDRVDRLPGGGRLIIDYKTGAVSTADWHGERPRAPQLPLYATSAGLDNIVGVAFVQVTAGNVRFMGLAADVDEMPPGIKTPGSAGTAEDGQSKWNGVLADWHDSLARLGDAYRAGSSEVDPLSQACRYCHLHSLCRVDEKRELGEVGEHG